ncbi:MAG: hypothetical protein M3463_12460, partial [Verrucomicrobiota bacterium]|nr:hypothetical protein [Verrucomicrobiota bacterium]
SRENLDRFAQDLLAFDDPRLRSSAVNAVGGEWSRKDPLRWAAYAAQHLQGENRNAALFQAVRSLAASKRFDEARSMIEQLPESSARSSAVNDLGLRWGVQDPKGALAWTQSLPSEKERRAAEQRILGSARLTVEDLVTIANTAPEEATRHTAVQAAARKLIDSDVESAIVWAEKLPEELRPSVQSKVAAKLAQSDLARGTAYALQIKAEKNKVHAIHEIARELTSKDPRATAQWIGGLPANLQEPKTSGLVMAWYDIDAREASAWVESLPAGRLRDRALMSLAFCVSKSDKTAGRDIAMRISDPGLRGTALRTPILSSGR